MARKTALIKISGDLCKRHDVMDWIGNVSMSYFVVICVGGGTQINEAFSKKNFPVLKHGPLGRESKTFEERQLARDILEKNQVEMQDLLADNGIVVNVVIPVLDIGSVLCHVNGDTFVLAAYLGFDKIYIITLKERVGEKQKQFKKYPKIEIVGF